MNQDIQKIIRNILNDVRVELSDEFDRNFERQAFFNEAWQRRSSPTRPGGSILIDTGKLRQSISSRTTDSSITFCSTLPYAAIHNDGGEVKVTARMKRFFWHKYHEATGSFGRKKNGERRNDKRTVQLSTEAGVLEAHGSDERRQEHQDTAPQISWSIARSGASGQGHHRGEPCRVF